MAAGLSMEDEELAETLVDAVNTGVDSEALVDAVSREHRYLQGNVFDQVMKPLICEYARKADAGEYDARNERQVKTCRDIADHMDWAY